MSNTLPPDWFLDYIGVKMNWKIALNMINGFAFGHYAAEVFKAGMHKEAGILMVCFFIAIFSS